MKKIIESRSEIKNLIELHDLQDSNSLVQFTAIVTIDTSKKMDELTCLELEILSKVENNEWADCL